MELGLKVWCLHLMSSSAYMYAYVWPAPGCTSVLQQRWSSLLSCTHTRVWVSSPLHLGHLLEFLRVCLSCTQLAVELLSPRKLMSFLNSSMAWQVARGQKICAQITAFLDVLRSERGAQTQLQAGSAGPGSSKHRVANWGQEGCKASLPAYASSAPSFGAAWRRKAEADEALLSLSHCCCFFLVTRAHPRSRDKCGTLQVKKQWSRTMH